MSQQAPPLTLSNLNRLLVILPSWVGDTVMATPLLRALRQQPNCNPELKITGYLRPGLDEIMAGSDLLDEMIVGQPLGWRGPLTEAKRLQAGRFDAVIILPNSFRMALTTMIAQIPLRIGYGRDGRTRLLTHPISCPRPAGWNDPIPAVEYYLNIAQQVGFVESTDHNAQLQLACSPEQQQQSNEILNQAGITEDERVALLNPGGNRIDKRWPAENFIQLANHLHSTYGMKVLVNGSPAETALLQSICQGVDQATSITNLADHQINLGTLKGICARAEILITNDTGTRHLAIGSAHPALAHANSKTPIRVVSLFGPTDPAWTTLDYPHEIEISTDGKPINKITTAQVFAACQTLLAP